MEIIGDTRKSNFIDWNGVLCYILYIKAVLVFLNVCQFSAECKETWTSGATESGVWIGNFNVKTWKTVEHKPYKIWRSLNFAKFEENEHTPRILRKIPMWHQNKSTLGESPSKPLTLIVHHLSIHCLPLFFRVQSMGIMTAPTMATMVDMATLMEPTGIIHLLK